MRIITSLFLSLCAFSASAASFPITKAPAGAEVFITSPQDGAVLTSPVTVQFGLKGMGIAPAGIEKANTGHHHLLINVDTLPAAGMPITADAQHLHFGGGQTQTELQLAPGTYTLQLDLGDHNHVPFEPAVVSKKITITVK